MEWKIIRSITPDWELLSFANGVPILKNYSYKYDLLTLRKVFVKGAVSGSAVSGQLLSATFLARADVAKINLYRSSIL